MPDVVKNPMDGPDGALSDDRVPTRGDWHTIAVNALVLLGIKVPTAEAEAITHADALLEELDEDADRRYQLREARKERRWSPPWRCDKCHAYTSSATSGCKRCGHPYASNDEGQRTSYARAHARRQRRRGRR